MRQILACLFVVAAAPPVTAGMCKSPEPVAVVLTPAKANADVVIVSIAPRSAAAQVATTKLETLTWKFHGLDTTITPLAPGLALVAPKVPPPDSALVLEDTAGKPIIAVTRGGAQLTPPAPKVKSLSVVSPQPALHGPSSTTTLVVSASPPKSTIAVLVYDPKAAIARAWAPINAGKETAFVLDEAHSCAWTIEGTRAVATGDHVVLAWLDASGAISPMSAPVTVR